MLSVKKKKKKMLHVVTSKLTLKSNITFNMNQLEGYNAP